MRKQPKTKTGFWVEDNDVFYEEVYMVGALISDWGPSHEPRRKPWQKKKEKPKKTSFGFARVLDE